MEVARDSCPLVSRTGGGGTGTAALWWTSHLFMAFTTDCEMQSHQATSGRLGGNCGESWVRSSWNLNRETEAKQSHR